MLAAEVEDVKKQGVAEKITSTAVVPRNNQGRMRGPLGDLMG